MENGFPQLDVAPKTGDEPFHRDGETLAPKLIDFWRWSASALLSNATRGVLAEYIVACALDVAASGRVEWDAYDLLSPEGAKIEVKSAAYLQSWAHPKLSAIRFDIRPTQLLENGANLVKRQAHVYVFCLLRHTDKTTVDPLNLEQWEFYILPTSVLDEKCATQKTIGLASLLKLHPFRAKYGEIAECIQKQSG